jgi:hypothetical protein
VLCLLILFLSWILSDPIRYPFYPINSIIPCPKVQPLLHTTSTVSVPNECSIFILIVTQSLSTHIFTRTLPIMSPPNSLFNRTAFTNKTIAPYRIFYRNSEERFCVITRGLFQFVIGTLRLKQIFKPFFFSRQHKYAKTNKLFQINHKIPNVFHRSSKASIGILTQNLSITA